MSNAVVLRSITGADDPDVAGFVGDAELASMEGRPAPATRLVRDVELEGDTWYVIEVDGGAVGWVGVQPLRGRAFRYGIGLAESARRQGIGSSAVRELLRLRFDEHNDRRAEAHVKARNEASLRMHERLGFQVEGRLRSAAGSPGDDTILLAATRPPRS